MTDILCFKVSLGAKLYRRLEIDGADSLEDLAFVINRAFDFDFDHAFGFYSDLRNPYSKRGRCFEIFSDMEERNNGIPGVRATKIVDAFQKRGAKMLYLFDYGDEWHFLVEMEDRKAPEKKLRYPRIVEKRGKAPEQYPEPEDE